MATIEERPGLPVKRPIHSNDAAAETRSVAAAARKTVQDVSDILTRAGLPIQNTEPKISTEVRNFRPDTTRASFALRRLEGAQGRVGVITDGCRRRTVL